MTTTRTADAAHGAGEATPGVWRLADFRLLWVGNAVSNLGSQVTMNALPLIAIVTLQASGTRVGLLQAAYTLPFLLATLPAGLWLERRARRPAMIAADLVRAGLVVTVAVAAWFGVLGWPQLYAVALLGGASTVVAEIAVVAYLPRLVGHRRLAAANSGMHANLAVGGIAGPGLAGWLTGLVGAASTLLLDAVSYAVSAVTLLMIRHQEEVAPSRPADRHLSRELREGLRAVFGNAPIRNAAAYTAVSAVGLQLAGVGTVVYLVRDLGVSPAWYGLTLMCGGLGGVLGTLAAPAIIRAHGYGPVMCAGAVLAAVPLLLVPASGRPDTATALSATAFFLAGAGGCVTGTASVTMRHLLTNADLHARMNASYRLLPWTSIPVAAVAAGVLVDAVGARTTLVVCPLILLAAVLPLALRPVRTLREITGVD